MQESIEQYIQEVIHKGGLNPSSAQKLMEREDDLLPLLDSASRVRAHFKGKRVKLCSIVNAKSGCCPENCAFCAQSAHHKTQIDIYPLMEPRQILKKAQEAEAMGARRFSIVTSGTAPREKDLGTITDALRLIREQTTLIPCASLGTITRHEADRLKKAGLRCYHHNLETSRSFFPQICTTHEYEEDLSTVRHAKGAGLEVCSGGIFGLGETLHQRLELAFTLKEMDVDSVALNFLNPIPGTPLEKTVPLLPLETLRSVALFRLILSDRDIRICGGREFGLRDLHPMVFWAGANGIMIGNYLTTRGRDYRADLQMIHDLALEIDDG